MSEPIVTKIEAPFDEPECHSMTEDSNELNYSISPTRGKIRHSDMLEYIRRKRPPMVRHSDGFLSFGGEVGYECGSCGFSAVILDEGRCPRCGEIIHDSIN
jgi:hypothetical protein